MQVKILLYLIFLLGGGPAGGKGVCGRLMSPAHETQSMREIRLLRGSLPRKGGGLTDILTGKMQICHDNANMPRQLQKCHDNANLKGKTQI